MMKRASPGLLCGLALAGLAAAGCEGSSRSEAASGSAGHGSAGSSGVGMPSPIPAGFLADAAPRGVPLRRLTRNEYRNIVRELFNVEPPASQALPDDSTISGFTNTAGQLVTIAAVSRYLDAASEVASRLEPDLLRSIPCSAVDAAAERTCVEQYLTTLGPRLFRRPWASDEQARYLAAFTEARATQSFQQSASLMIEALLVAPEFLFVELPSGGAAGERHALDDWQMASRLSLLLWDSIPDAPLAAAAREGQLGSSDALAQQVERLLQSERARPALSSFFDDWLGFAKIATTVRDADLYPSVDATLLSELAAESRAFVDDVFWQGADFRQLFVSPVRFRSAALSAFYGDGLGQTAGLVRHEGEVSERSFGLLSQAGFLMTLAQAEKSAPIHRGAFLRRKLLCGVLPPPPPGLATPLPELTSGVSKRQRVSEHTSGAACAACHRSFNGLGFALDHFDIAGQWRDQDEGLPIDTKVTLDEPGLFAEVDGARALSEALAQSPIAQACALQQLFTFALERAPTQADQEMFDALGRRFESSGFSLKAALVELVHSEPFRTRIEPPGSTP